MILIKKPAKEKSVVKSIRMTLTDERIIAALAKRYAGGNFNLWVRYAALNHLPVKKEDK